MRILIDKIIERGNDGIAWIEPGEYEVVREFDQDRWLINITRHPWKPNSRQLTLVQKDEVVIVS